MKLKGAVLLIGSLAWENETNAIDKTVGKLRSQWREENLDLEKAISVKCPIRYGRKSNTRHNTYTMVFSESVPVLGTALLVPIKEEVSVTVDDLSVFHNQALLLARAEGICKSDEDNLYKKWGSVALSIHNRLKDKDYEIYASITNYWEKYFNNILIENDYRVGSYEKPAITSNGFVNFDLDIDCEFDFFLCTATKPDLHEYPSAIEISRKISDSKYSTYFFENLQNRITTFQDEEIISELPISYTDGKEFKGVPIKFSDYKDNGEGLNRLSIDLRIRLRDSLFAPTLQGLCFSLLKELVYPFERTPGINIDEVEKGCKNAIQEFEKHFGYSNPSLSEHKRGNVCRDFLALVMDLEEAPGVSRSLLEHEVLEDLKKISELIAWYERHDYIKELIEKNTSPRSHSERTIHDYYKRVIREQQVILKYFFNGLSERAITKSKIKHLFLGSLMDWYHDRPYSFAKPYSEGFFNHEKIDLCGHRLNNLPVREGAKFRKLFKEDKKQFYIAIQDYFGFDKVIHEINYYVGIIPAKNPLRANLIKEMISLFNEKKWFGFYGLALGQIEGIFQEMAESIKLASKLPSLPDKVQAVRGKTKDVFALDYYQYHIPNQRNKFMHSGIEDDVETKSYDLIYDVHYILEQFAKLDTPAVEIELMIKRHDTDRFINISDFSALFESLEKLKESGHFKDLKDRYSSFENEFLCRETDIDFSISEMYDILNSLIREFYDQVISYTTINSKPFDLRNVSKKEIDDKPEHFISILMPFFRYNYEQFERLNPYYIFLIYRAKYLPSLSAESLKSLNKVEKSFLNDLEKIYVLSMKFNKLLEGHDTI